MDDNESPKRRAPKSTCKKSHADRSSRPHDGRSVPDGGSKSSLRRRPSGRLEGEERSDAPAVEDIVSIHSIPELRRIPTGSSSYPSVDRAHRREFVHDRDDLTETTASLIPEPTSTTNADSIHPRPVDTPPRSARKPSTSRKPSTPRNTKIPFPTVDPRPYTPPETVLSSTQVQDLEKSAGSRPDVDTDRGLASKPQNLPPPPAPLPIPPSQSVPNLASHVRKPDTQNGSKASSLSKTSSLGTIDTPSLPAPSIIPLVAPTETPPSPPPPSYHSSTPSPPKVDYLLQHGGLPQAVSRSLFSAVPNPAGSRSSNPSTTGAETFFAPFFDLLDQYQTVVDKNGSVAVATGYRSVARRLLDRLESVFCRNLPIDGCSCIMCQRDGQDTDKTRKRDLGWGDILEWVSGRIELPPWPPFDLATLGADTLAEADSPELRIPGRPASPTRMDPDIAEEFREHYLRQTKRVRSAVDRWLNRCSDSAPPTGVDDGTLAFAILTSLSRIDQPYFNAILAGSRHVHASVRAPTPNIPGRQRPELLIRAGSSLQRLYRLPEPPRDPETAAYLVKYPHTHHVLYTILHIHPSEWEILTSGRFNGFLWSGSEPSLGVQKKTFDGSPAQTDPHSLTPALPVSNDEEMECVALAEIEYELYLGMEALEDVFETLHHRAEAVRVALRNRHTALSSSLEARGRAKVNCWPAALDTPITSNPVYERAAAASARSGPLASMVSGNSSRYSLAHDSEDYVLNDYDLGPDDSVSNAPGVARYRRQPAHRTTKRTSTSVIEEE